MRIYIYIYVISKSVKYKEEAALYYHKLPSTRDLEERATIWKWMLQENYFSNRFDTFSNGFTLPWQANRLALMVLPMKPQSFVAAQTHFSLSLYGLQQTTHVTFVWIIYCLGKASMKLLF